MKHTLPWNVTGIPPEAREVARAAAHREGLTVGEWMTRRILAESARAQDGAEAAEEAAPTYPQAHEQDMRRDSDDLAVRVTRTEVEGQAAFRRIDEALRAMSRRLEASEHAQSEAQRAMSAAAGEFHAATRDQAQAFELLAARIDSVERQGDGGAIRDAIRGLHQGLSRLADQVANSTNESSGQMTDLAGRVEALAGKIDQAGDESSRVAEYVEAKFAALDARIKQVEDGAGAALESGIEAFSGKIAGARAESKRLADYVEAKLSALDARLTQSLEAVGVELESRIETRIRSVEERIQEAFERHSAAQERVFEELAKRLEKEDAEPQPDPAIQEALRNLGTRLDSSEKKVREGLADLETTIAETAKRIAKMESASPHWAPLPPERPAQVPVESFRSDPQPYPKTSFTDDRTPEAEDPETEDSQSENSELEETVAGWTLANDEVFAGVVQPARSPALNYLEQARRAARASAEPESDRAKRAKLKVPLPGDPELPISLDAAPVTTRRISQPVAMAALVLLLAAVGFQVTRNLWTQSQNVALELDQRAALAQPSGTGPDVANSGTAVPAPAPIANPQLAGKTPAGDAPPSAVRTPNAPLPATSSIPAATAEKASAETVSQLVAQANAGDAKAALALGLKYVDATGVSANESEAARWLLKAAQAGMPVAQYRLGTLYERGRGVEPDQNQAIHWYGEAAKRGNRKAMHNLAVAYASGADGKKNFTEAIRWFKAAAELGLADSQFNLAVLYERGLGAKPSLSEAYKWYAIAATSGDSESQARAEALASQIPAAAREAVDRMAKGYKPQPMNVAANDGPAPTSN